jgi:hypothetical protein
MEFVNDKLESLKGRLNSRLTQEEVATIQTQLNFFPSFASSWKTLLRYPQADYVEAAKGEHGVLLESLTKRVVTEQQFRELSISLKVLAMKVDVKHLLSQKFQLLQEDSAFLEALIVALRKPMKEEERTRLKENLDRIKRLCHQEVTKEEIQQIVKAMGLGQGNLIDSHVHMM